MDKQKQECSDSICFGLNRKKDEQSLSVFLKLFSRDKLLDTLLPRLKQEEIEEVTRVLTRLMYNNLKKNEYHQLFLSEDEERR
jgi:hypothetical protein